MRILALSREATQDFVTRQQDKKIAVISITDPKSKLAKITNLPILRLQFHDVEDNYPCDNNSVIKFTPIMAREIIDFVNFLVSTIDLFVVHCEAGVSRSAATAAAISRILDLDQSKFFKYPYLPNKLVYQTLMKSHLGITDNIDMPVVEALANRLPDDYFGNVE